MTDNLVCPYSECGKGFVRPIVLTDFSRTPRETYYACPHCLTKVDVVARDPSLDSVSLESAGSPVERAPSGCQFQFGYLKTLPRQATVPDGCLTCPKLLQCFVKREK